MALQTTGAITLANIQTEFGGANPISLSEYYAGGGLVPSGTAGIPTSSTISIGSFYGASNYTGYWLTELRFNSTYVSNTFGGYTFTGSSSAAAHPCQAQVQDSSENVFIGGAYSQLNVTTTAALPSGIFIKLNYNGSVAEIKVGARGNGDGTTQSQKNSYNLEPRVVYIDSLGNIIFFGQATKTGVSNSSAYARAQSPGALPTFSSGIYNGITARRTFMDSSGARWYFSNQGNNTGAGFIYSDTYANQTKRIKQGTDSSTGGNYVDCGVTDAVGASGNLYVAGRVQTTRLTTPISLFVMKMDTNGTVLWTSYLGANTNSGVRLEPYQIQLSGNYVYVVGSNTGAAGTANTNTVWPFIAKWDTSGTLQFQRYITTAGNISDIVFDSSGNYYVTFNSTLSTIAPAILKYNSSDVLQWTRSITAPFDSGVTSRFVLITAISLDSTGSKLTVTVCRGYHPNAYIAVIRLPTDGSKTGTYGSYTYASASLTVADAITTTTVANFVNITTTTPSSPSYGDLVRASTAADGTTNTPLYYTL